MTMYITIHKYQYSSAKAPNDQNYQSYENQQYDPTQAEPYYSEHILIRMATLT